MKSSPVRTGNFIINLITLSLSILSIAGCSKWVEVPPPTTQISNTSVYSQNASAIAVLTAIYSNWSSIGFSANMSKYMGLNADEVSLNISLNPAEANYYLNTLNSSLLLDGPIWNQLYNVIYTSNSTIEGLSDSSSGSLTPSVRRQLLGEAYFLRAFCDFQLVNIYGEIPIIKSTDYTVSRLLPKSPAQDVYTAIISDLEKSETYLSDLYLDGTLQNATPERIRPNKWVAEALLSKTYLYAGDWQNAIIHSSNLINSSSFQLEPLETCFQRSSLNNNEAIWQLQPVISDRNTAEAIMYIIPATGPSGAFPYYLNPNLMNAFEANDQRKTVWTDSIISGGITYNYAYKYKVDTATSDITEYPMVFRIGEQYLISAEAKAHASDATAVDDLNKIRERAGLADYSGATDMQSLLTAIQHERQVELFTEWGNRWFDLRRTGAIDSVMSNAVIGKGTSWSSYKALFPIPIWEIKYNPNMVQNTGY